MDTMYERDATVYEGTEIWDRRNDRRAGRDRRKSDRRASDQPVDTKVPLTEAEIAALLNGAR